MMGNFDSQGFNSKKNLRNLDAVSRVWSNLTELLNLNCGRFEHLCVAEFAVRLKNLLCENILLLSGRHHDGRVAVGPLAAHGALDAAPVVVEVGGEHLAVIVKCPLAALRTQPLPLGLLGPLPGPLVPPPPCASSPH